MSMHVVIGGASGFLGSALADRLSASGHQVTRLVRSSTSGTGQSLWDPASGRIDQHLIDSADAVVNLSGSSIAAWPRTDSRRRELLASRLGPTQTLADAIARSAKPPIFLSGSAMAYYGVDRGTETLSESASAGTGFTPDLVQQWEAAAQPAIDAGARTCFLRTSLVQHRSGGMLRMMLPAWKLWAGARIGDGQQRMSLISRDDWVGAVEFLLANDVDGPVNLAIRPTVTNAEFTKALAEQVGRRAFFAAPGAMLKLALGEISDDLLGSMDLVPDALEGAGFTFADPDLSALLKSALR